MKFDTQAVLSIRDLDVSYQTAGRSLPALRRVSLDVFPGETVGLVGESGSGKSTLALAVMRYLNPEGCLENGRILFRGQDLLAFSPAQMRSSWGRHIALVPQDPYASLNPSMRIGQQLAECLHYQGDLSSQQAAARVAELLEMVRLPDDEGLKDSYPHQISGGMRQRVLIAMALSLEPDLLILDEPTTGLDVTTEAAILDLLRDLIQERQTAVLYVTHNLGVVAGLCDRVAVLYAGELVEVASTAQLFARPLNPYTRGLLDSVPRMGQYKHEIPLRGIAGAIPPLGALPSGCAFAARCPLAVEICSAEHPILDRAGEQRWVRCHRWAEIEAGAADPRQEAGPPAGRLAQIGEGVLSMADVRVEFPRRRSLGDVLRARPPQVLPAVDGVTLEVRRGETLGIVGESGSGKTSLARAAAGLVDGVRGEMWLLGSKLPGRYTRRSREMLAALQMVFQNPGEALNPYLTIGESLQRPLVRLAGMSRSEAEVRAGELLASVRLPPEYAVRRPRQLSGGEQQRLGLARAFAALPDLILADEAVSSLDVSVQASILNLVVELQAEHETAVVFISHDIGVVAYLADRMAVMYLGQLVEVGPAAHIFNPPYHPYSEALLSAVPVPDPTTRQERIRLQGEVPAHGEIEGGCPFYNRCPRVVGDICREQIPPWQETAGGKRIFCHIPLHELETAQSRVIVWRDGDGKEGVA